MKQEQCPPNSASRLPLFLPILVLAITAIPWAQCQRYDQGSGGRHNNRFALNSVPSHSNNFNKFKHDILLKKRSSGGGDEEEEEDGGEFNGI